MTVFFVPNNSIMAPTTFQILLANILPCLRTPDIDAVSPPRSSRSRTRKIITATQYQQHIYFKDSPIMAPTTRRQSRLLELGELPGSHEGKTGKNNMNRHESSVGEVVEKKNANKEDGDENDVASKTKTSTSTTAGQAKESEQKGRKDGVEDASAALNQDTQSTEKLKIFHALDPEEREQEHANNEKRGLFRASSIVSITNNDAQNAESPADSDSNSDSDSGSGLESDSDGLEAAFTTELEIEEDPSPAPKPPSAITITPIPPPSVSAPSSQSSSMTMQSAPPPVLGKPSFQTGMVYLAAEYKPWEIVYQCVECEADVRIRGGGPVRNTSSGGNIELLRCRDCGCRVLLKKRTKRAVQFEAR